MKTLHYPLLPYLFDIITNTVGQNLDLVIMSPNDFLSYINTEDYRNKINQGFGIPDFDVADVFTVEMELEFITKLFTEKEQNIDTLEFRKSGNMEDTKFYFS